MEKVWRTGEEKSNLSNFLLCSGERLSDMIQLCGIQDLQMIHPLAHFKLTIGLFLFNFGDGGGLGGGGRWGVWDLNDLQCHALY